MDAVEVVEGEVALELAPEAGEARVQVACEGRPPALVEDRLVQRLDVTVGLGATGVDVGDARAETLDAGVEERALELVAVVGEDAFEPPASRLQLARHAPGELRGLLCRRVALAADDELGPGERGADVDRGQLPDRTLGPAQASDVEAVEADELAGPLDLDVRLGYRLLRRLVGAW